MTHTLYLVPTPLGDPDDITLRALRILREVSAIVDFTTRDTQTLLDHYGITAMPIISPDHTLQALELGDVALIAAGTPGIGDAAQEIVREAIARGIRVEPLPGASAEITALVLSGLPTDAFVYVSELPDDLTRFAHEHDTMIFKAAADLDLALEKLLAAFGDRRICVATHLTQDVETIYRGTISAAQANVHELSWANEFMFVIAGAPQELPVVWDEGRVRVALRQRLADGEMLKTAAKAVAELAGWDRRAVYALGVDEKQNPP
jgi:16S rRNA (cytidine1402-2'-O)-methyltransferase